MPANERGLPRRKRVLITGAAGGLGKAFAVASASRRWDLFLTDLSLAPLDTLAASLCSTYGVNVITHACDLTEPAERNALLERIYSEGVRFTMLINVAGIDFEGRFLDQSRQQIQTIIRLNIEATLAVTHSILPYRSPQEVFRVINVSSLAAFYPMPVKATYAASKRFLLDFSLALREELRELGISVTVLCPAGMPTHEETVKAIEAQGWVGQITTVDVGRVAHQTLDAALSGKALVIPGQMNRLLQTLGGLIPPGLVARMIGKRWSAVRQQREEVVRLAEIA